MSALFALHQKIQNSKDKSFFLDAPIKINLALHILGKRSDGYHDLETLISFSGAGDRLYFSHGEDDSFTAEGSYAAQMGDDKSNLVIKARDAIYTYLNKANVIIDEQKPVALHLKKNIPVAAGLGGGSADAAACLFGLSAMIGGKALEPDYQNILWDIAADLGADVPMCLGWFFQKGTYLARKKGEDLSLLASFPALPMVIVNNGEAISTAKIFALLDKKNNAAIDTNLLQQNLSFDACISVLKSLRNDLYIPALKTVPALQNVLNEIKQTGAAFEAMSGSGASCFGIYETMGQAHRAEKLIKQNNPNYFVLATNTNT